jgi:hypothetical protein
MKQMTSEQIEARREAVRRHRARRKAQQMSMRGTPAVSAFERLNRALCVSVFGRFDAASGRQLPAWQRSDCAALALYDLLGAEGASRLRDALARAIEDAPRREREARKALEKFGLLGSAGAAP